MILTTMNNLRGYELQATDGKLGKIDALYFDEDTWKVRYLVVNVGNWLMRQYVLLTPDCIEYVDREQETVVVSLTKDQIENSPDIDTQKTISREKEEMLHDYYAWVPYWRTMPVAAAGAPYGVPLASGALMMPGTAQSDQTVEERPERSLESTLRSTKEVKGYNIYANNGEIGHVETFLVDSLHWVIRYVIVDTGKWLPGRQVLIAPMWVSGMRWADSEMYLDLTKEQVETSPEYVAERYIYRDYETRLYDHYDQPPYWHKEI